MVFSFKFDTETALFLRVHMHVVISGNVRQCLWMYGGALQAL